MSNKTLGLILALFTLCVMLMVIAIVTNTSQSPAIQTVTRSSMPPAPQLAQTTLALSPNPLSLSSPSASLAVVANTGTNAITTVQIELKFDPKTIGDITLTQGDFLTGAIVLIKNIDYQNGRLSYALGIPAGIQGKMGTGTVAVIHFTTSLASGQQTQLQFLPKSLATIDGTIQSVLKSTSGGTIIFSPQTTQSIPSSMTRY